MVLCGNASPGCGKKPSRRCRRRSGRRTWNECVCSYLGRKGRVTELLRGMGSVPARGAAPTSAKWSTNCAGNWRRPLRPTPGAAGGGGSGGAAESRNHRRDAARAGPGAGAQTSADASAGRHQDGVHRPRLYRRGRARGGDRLLQLRGAEHSAGSSGPGHAGHVFHHRRHFAAHADVAGADPRRCWRRSRPCASSRRARCSGCDADVTHSPMFHQVEGLVRRRGRHLRRPEGHADDAGPGAVGPAPGALSPQLLPVYRAQRGDGHRVHHVPTAPAAASAATKAGWRFSAPAWSIPRC